MAFEKPTLTQIINRVISDIELHTGKSASTRGDIYFPLAMAHAGACYGIHGHIDYTRDQLFDDSADDDHLLLRAEEMGIYQLLAYRATGTISTTGNDGNVINAGTLYTKSNQYWIVTNDVIVVDGVAILSVRSVAAGVAGNLTVGTTLSIMQTIIGIDTSATVVSIAGGADVEPVARVRERLAERRKKPPMGGSPNDYIQWALAAHADVTRAWCYSNENGAGTVVVRFVTDNLATQIPTSTHNDAVYAYIDAVRPAGMAGFEVGVITAKALDIVFTSLTPNTVAVRLAIAAELDDMLRREAIPGGTILLSHIREAISSASGENDYIINLTANVSSAANELIVLGEMSWP